MSEAQTRYRVTGVTGRRASIQRKHPVAVQGVILDLADRLRQLAPSARNPERFHEEKSEIVHALRLIAREVAHG